MMTKRSIQYIAFLCIALPVLTNCGDTELGSEENADNPTLDRVPPVITLPDDLVLEASSPDGISSNDPRILEFVRASTGIDNIDPDPNLVYDAPAVFPIGTTIVTFTYTDSSGNSTSGAATVIVTYPDSVAPVVSVPDDIALEAQHPAGIENTNPSIIEFLEGSSAVDNTDPNPVLQHNGPSTFPVGTTSVTFTYTDFAGNSSSQSANVTVSYNDTQPPVLSTPNDITLEATSPTGIAQSDPSIVIFLGTADATDNVDPSPDIQNNAPTVFPVGNTLVTFTATDRAGNNSTGSATVTVTFGDTIPPVISVPEDLVIAAPSESGVSISDPEIATFLNSSSATDNTDPNPVLQLNAPDVFPVGYTEVTFTYTDQYGNSDSETATVLVTFNAAVFCDISTALYCNDFSNLNVGEITSTPQNDVEYPIANPKGLAIRENTGGFANTHYLDTGSLKVAWNDGPERGLGYGMNPYGLDRLGIRLVDELYVGVMVWVSTDSLRAMNEEEWKHMAAETIIGQNYGSRPTLFMYPIRDSRSEVGSSVSNYNSGASGTYYWIPMLASDANGHGATDEHGSGGFNGATNYYIYGNVHNFRWNDYADEWVYVEIKFSTLDASSTSHELYIYTQDGVFQGSSAQDDSPMMTVNSLVDHDADGTTWYSVAPHYYPEQTSGTSAATFIKYDNFQINTSFMGPPVGFYE